MGGVYICLCKKNICVWRFIYDCVKNFNIGWERVIYACVKKIFVYEYLYMIAQNFNIGRGRFIYAC